MAAAGITRIFPDLTDDLLLNLFHSGAKAQWTSRDLDWSQPFALSARQRLALARVLTPVYFGEQTAMAGASAILPSVMAAGETTAQLYLASFIMDEARHFETLTRLYRALGHDPLGIREMPELLRFYHRLRQGDRADWVWGILVTDIIGKHFYRSLGVNQRKPDPLVGGLSRRIVRDESRHLAFAEHYLTRNVPGMSSHRRLALLAMRDELLRLLASMSERVRADAAAFEVDVDDFVGGISTDVTAAAQRVGLLERQPRDPPARGPSGSVNHGSPDGPSITRQSVNESGASDEATFVERCFGCLLSLICSRRLTATT